MTSVDVVSVSARMMSADHALAPLADPVVCIAWDVGCAVAESLFTLDSVTSVAVESAEGSIGLLSRGTFMSTLVGPLGFGRALLRRQPVGDLCDWDCLIINSDTSIPAAVDRAIGRTAESRYDDVLVRTEEGLGVVSTARLVEAMAGLLAARSLQDQLTGLANRELAFHHLRELCGRDATGQSHVAVVYVDLDDFKQVNDAHGHAVGDSLLITVANRLRSAARPGDLVARLGGDEFAIIIALDDPTQDGGREVAAGLGGRFLAAVHAGEPIHTVGSCRASVGVAIAHCSDADSDTLMREADLAMYAAKSGGGAQLHVTTQVTKLDSADTKLLVAALAYGWLEPYFQPIVDVTTGAVVSVEALARLRHPERGILSPADFLPGAPPSAMRGLDDAMLVTALSRLLYAEAEEGAIKVPFVNINLSRASLTRTDLASHVLGLLDRVGFPPARLRIEIPEIADLEVVQDAAPHLRRLQLAGIAVTLDDVGAGSSSLRHVSQLPVDGLKIDRSFIARLPGSDRDLAVVRMLIDLGAGLGLKVTAEGVETKEQLSVLKQLGCPFAQGFFLGVPAPLTALGHQAWTEVSGSRRSESAR